MKTLCITLIAAAMLVACANPVTAQTYNARLMMHSQKPITADSSLNLSVRVVLPNYTAMPSKTLINFGPRFVGRQWWSELLVGRLIISQQGKWHLESRTSLDQFGPWHFFVDLVYFSDHAKYSYLDANYAIGKLGLIGMESENNYLAGQDDLSAGPHLIVPFHDGKLVLQSIYQFHNHGGNQIWFRTVLNF